MKPFLMSQNDSPSASAPDDAAIPLELSKTMPSALCPIDYQRLRAEDVISEWLAGAIVVIVLFAVSVDWESVFDAMLP